MIHICNSKDFAVIYEIINEAALAYRGVIPDNCWHEPYMSADELQHEIADGVVFWGYEEKGILEGVMGIQHVQDVTLLRHAYVRSRSQKRGIGRTLLLFLKTQTRMPALIGTWAEAKWAVRFYEKNGFQPVSREEKDLLLRRYWKITERQIDNSVVLADEKWMEVFKAGS